MTGAGAVDLRRLELTVAQQSQARIDEALAPLSEALFLVLHRLAQDLEAGVRMSVLARDVAYSSGGTTKLLDRLEVLGLAGREHHRHDRRVVIGRITEDGLARYRALVPVYETAVLGEVVSP